MAEKTIVFGSTENLKKITGVTIDTFGVSTEDELNEILLELLTRITAHIRTRLKEEIDIDDYRFAGLSEICERYAAHFLAIARQQRTGDIVTVNDFGVHILHAREVLQGLNEELTPYQKRKLGVFLSGQDIENEN